MVCSSCGVNERAKDGFCSKRCAMRDTAGVSETKVNANNKANGHFLGNAFMICRPDTFAAPRATGRAAKPSAAAMRWVLVYSL